MTHISISIEKIRPHSTASLTVPIIIPRQSTALLIVTYLPPAGTHITQIFPHQPKESSSAQKTSTHDFLQHLREWPTFCISINDLLSNYSH